MNIRQHFAISSYITGIFSLLAIVVSFWMINTILNLHDNALKIEKAIIRSLEIWPLIIQGDYQAAMLKLHTKSSET